MLRVQPGFGDRLRRGGFGRIRGLLSGSRQRAQLARIDAQPAVDPIGKLSVRLDSTLVDAEVEQCLSDVIPGGTDSGAWIVTGAAMVQCPSDAHS